MSPIKIGIIEDDLIIAASISEMLRESGYEVTEFATRYSAAITMIEREHPDLLLIDINILGKKDGIEVARTVQETFRIPFIFLTAYTDMDTIARAKKVSPAAYLAKPVTKAQLIAAIEIAVSVWNSRQDTLHPPVQQDSIFVKDGYSMVRIKCSDILYASSEQNYIRIMMANGTELVIRSTMGDFERYTVGHGLLRVHRAYMVQAARVDQLLATKVLISGQSIPVSRAYRDSISTFLRANNR